MESWGHSANFWADRHIDDNLIRPHLEAAFSLTCRQFSPLFCHQRIEDQIGDDPILASTLVHTHQLGGSQWLGGAKRYQTYIQYVPTSKQEIYQLIRSASVYRSSSQAKFSLHSPRCYHCCPQCCLAAVRFKLDIDLYSVQECTKSSLNSKKTHNYFSTLLKSRQSPHHKFWLTGQVWGESMEDLEEIWRRPERLMKRGLAIEPSGSQSPSDLFPIS